MKGIILNIKFLLTISGILFLVFSASSNSITNSVVAQNYNPGNACGFTNPDVQFWGNCSVNPYSGCKADNTQDTQWGWFGQTDFDPHKFKTSPTNPFWMQVQCFVQLSLGPGCATPSYVEVKDTTTNTVIATQYKNDCTALVFQVYNPGTYRATCYNNSSKSCTASYDTFTLWPRVPPCVAAAPPAPTLQTPANGANVNALSSGTLGNYVNLTFTGNGFGQSCPDLNSNYYYMQVSDGCTGVYTNRGTYTASATHQLPVSKGQKYCWRVLATNGQTSTYSSVYQFHVIDDTTVINKSGVDADVCGNGFSGVAGVSGVSNPILYNVDYITSSQNTPKELWLAVVPANDAYNKACPALGGGSTISNNVCQNMESADTQSEAIILQKVRNANGFAAKLQYGSNGFLASASVYNGSTWVSATSGNLSGLGGTLMEIGQSSTNMTKTSISMNGRFKIRFDSVPLGKYYFYGAALMQDLSGTLNTSYSGALGNFVYKKFRADSTIINSIWGIDLTPPNSTGSFATAKYIAADKFQINWNFSEPNSLQLKSFVSRDNPDSSLTDGTSGVIDFSVTPPNTDNFNNGSIQLSAINPFNGYVTESTQGTRTYTDADPTKQSNYQFLAYARDLACNQKVLTTTAALQKPWVLSYNGDLSAAKGIIGLSVPTGLDQLPDVLKTSYGTALSDKQSVYLSTYGAISGTSDIPVRKQSKTQQYITNYDNLAIKPPLDSGYTKWYDYIYDQVSKNASAPIKTIAATSLSGNTSAFLGIAAGTKTHALINGKLTVNAGVTCDTQTIFFVAGNSTLSLDATFPNTTLKISPDFKVSGNNNGCMFVTLGDILVDKGSRVTTSVLIDSTQLANYDSVEAALITDSQFVTTKDVFTTTEKGDGVSIKGSVVSENVYLQRDINLNANQLQPAQLFIYDPRYREIFKNDLNYNKYSIREQGFSN